MTIEQLPPLIKNLILIVDDDPITRRLLRLAMEKEGYEVVEAHNGEQGLALFSQRVPDIVLLDFMMPVMNGVEFCHHLQELMKTTEPVLAPASHTAARPKKHPMFLILPIFLKVVHCQSDY